MDNIIDSISRFSKENIDSISSDNIYRDLALELDEKKIPGIEDTKILYCLLNYFIYNQKPILFQNIRKMCKVKNKDCYIFYLGKTIDIPEELRKYIEIMNETHFYNFLEKNYKDYILDFDSDNIDEKHIIIKNIKNEFDCRTEYEYESIYGLYDFYLF